MDVDARIEESDVKTILAVSGSYREGGVTDQAVDVAARALSRAGCRVEVVRLREYPIEFCRNCRECTQLPGESPGRCVLHDAMEALVGKIEAADGFVLASPTNFFSVTALFKRFMERLVVYAYWPWGMRGPQTRRKPTRKAIVVTSSAAPSVLGRIFYASTRQLRLTAKTIGAKPVGSVFIGLAGGEARARLTDAQVRRIEGEAARLLA